MIIKSQVEILEKLGIASLNKMQIKADLAIRSSVNVQIISPTGTGKTLAFLLPLISTIDHHIHQVQVMIVVPTRELAIQIEQVVRDMGAGVKCNAVYGGQSFNKDKLNLRHPPMILVGTPGRIADHLRRGTFLTDHINALVLDEFDKSLEIGFESEMNEISAALQRLERRVLTSATDATGIPEFIHFVDAVKIKTTDKGTSQLRFRVVISPTKDKLETLADTLKRLSGQPGIVFCNFKDSIQRVSEYLWDLGIPHGCFYGGMEQNDRERALIKFRNGSHQLIIATDLAARGLDVPEIKFIIHYHLPLKEHEFVHRNGRTARMHSSGTVYVIQWKDERLPEYMPEIAEATWEKDATAEAVNWKTILISGGRKDKISKGDIVGFCLKQGGIRNDQLGIIELKQDCAFVSVESAVALDLIQSLDGLKLKTKRVKVSGV